MKFKFVFYFVAGCDSDEYDCEDNTCIARSLRCNGRINCRFRWDEDECIVSRKSICKVPYIIAGVGIKCHRKLKFANATWASSHPWAKNEFWCVAALRWRGVNEWICCFQSKHVSILNSEHIIIILVIFTLILSGMCFAFVFNCTRKLIRDHRIMKVSAAPISFISLSLTRRVAYAVLNGRALEWNLILLTHPLTQNRTLTHFIRRWSPHKRWVNLIFGVL